MFNHLLLLLLYRVQTRRNLFQWVSLGLLPFLVPAGFVGILQTSRCRRLPGKIGVSSRAPKKWVDPRAQGPLPSEVFISAWHQAACVSMATRYSSSTVSGREATELVFVGDLASFTVPDIFWESSTWLKESMPPLTWESLSPSARTDDAPRSKGSIALPKAFLITYK
jgi:hypothetical protein